MTRYLAVTALSVGVIATGAVGYATDNGGSQTDPGNETKIIGGGEATEDYPFIASLQYEYNGDPDSHRCTGSLVDADWVLLAAHCVVGSDGVSDPSLFHVRVGSLDRTSGGTVANVAAIAVHPDYEHFDDRSSGHDLALVQLDTEVSEKPIPLADALPDAGEEIRWLGWGYVNVDDGPGHPEKLPKKLHELDATVLDPDTPECVSDGEDGDAWGIRDGDFCVDNPGGDSGTCGGDSGGPAMANVNGRWTLYGLNSRALGSVCGTSKDIATGVASHGDWISGVID